jgi:hypothetical protein
MPAGLSTTIELLTGAANDTAAAVLVSALDVRERDIREAAVTALVSRRSDMAAAAALTRWNDLPPRCKSIIAHRAGWLSDAIKGALADGDLRSHQCACAAAVFTRDYDLMPVFVAAATDRFNPHAALAAAATLELAELLSDELSTPRDYRIRRDPKLQRNHVLPSLEKAVSTLEEHGRSELLEAFVLLAERENAALKRLLQSPADHEFRPLVELLESSSRPAAMRLLLSYLDDPHAPLAAIKIIGRRCDVSFLRLLARKIGEEPTAAQRGNLRRIESIPWIMDNLSVLGALHEAEQAGAVHLAALSSVKRRVVYEAVAYVLREGKVAGRRVAAKALAAFSGVEVNELVVAKLEDADPEVRAALARQLRPRGIADAIPRLVALLGSPYEVEREAARAGLEEFQFERFAANFENLTAEARSSTGRLVRSIDPRSVVEVRRELAAPTRSRRLRALEMALALDSVAELHESIAALLDDEDQFVRVEAIRALATVDCQATRQVLRNALLDSHALVQKAAEAALTQFTLAPQEPAAALALEVALP